MKYILTIIYISCISFAYSQKEDYNWVIHNCRIDFNTNPPTIHTMSNIGNQFLQISMSDKNGEFLFYSYNKKLYNFSNQKICDFPSMSHVTGVMNVIPHPTIDKNFFYISTVQRTKPNRRQVLYLVDMNANAGNGQVTELSIMDKKEYLTNKYLITRKCNSNDYWFFRFKDNKIIRNTIDASGLKDDTTVKNFMKVDRVKISPDMSKLFISNYKRTKFYVADYDCKTAEIKNIKQFAEDNNIGGKPKSNVFEFSRNGNYLFRISNKYIHSNSDTTKTIAIKYDMSKVNDIQAFSNSADTLQIINPTTIRDEFPNDATLAPNGKIYVSVVKAGYLLAVEENNSFSEGYVLNKKSIYLNGNKATRSLPHYFNYHASFNYNVACDVVTLNYLGMPVQNLHWDFGDGITSDEQNPTHRYTTAGTYTVILTATYANNTIQTAEKTITISEKPEKPVIIHN